MHKRVLKWNVPVDDKPHDIGPGKVVHVACQNGPDVVQVWTEEFGDLFPLMYQKRAQVFGTGHPVNEYWEHAGSVVVPPLVWHVYIEPSELTRQARSA